MTLQDPCWKLARLLPEPCWIPCWNFARNVVSCFGWCSCFGYCANLWCWKYGINFVGVVLQPCQNLDEDNFLLCFGFRLDFFSDCFLLCSMCWAVLGFGRDGRQLKTRAPCWTCDDGIFACSFEDTLCWNPGMNLAETLCWSPCRISSREILVGILVGFFPQTALELIGIPNSCQKRPLFLHDLLASPGSGWASGACLPFTLFFGSGACLPSSLFFISSGKGFCSIMIRWFFHVLPGSGWDSGACLPSSLFFGSGACLLSSLFFLSSGKGFCSIMICWFFLVLPGSRWGSGACLPSSLFFGSGACLPSSSLFFLCSGKGFCSIMLCWLFLLPAGVPLLVSLILSSSWVPVLVSLLLSSFFPQERGSVPSWFASSSMFLLVLAGVPVLVSLLSFFFQDKGSVLSWISRFLLLRAGVPVLVSLLPFMEQSGWSSGVKQKTRVRQIVSWNLNCTSPWWKHALLLFGVYAGVIFGNHNQSYRFSLWFVLSVCIFVCFMCGALRSCFMHL